jgi:ABC-type Fe3+ transport system permease subunit
MMVYVKSILVGLGAAILSLVLLAAIAIVISLPQEQIAGIGAIAVPASGILIVSLTMFAVGFVWMFRRSSRKSR